MTRDLKTITAVSMNHGISVIIPAYNEAICLPQTLEAILEACARLRSETQLETEIILVDNASNDATALVAKDYGVRVLNYTERNIAGVRNHGARHSQLSVVVTVDADTFVPRDAFVKIWQAMETGKYFGGGVKTGVKTKSRLQKLSYAAINSIILKRENVSLGMFFCQREIFEELGGFPEEFLVGEDLAFARRLRDFSRTRGKEYCNLQTVCIETLARKSVTFSETFCAYYNSAKIAFGYPVKKNSLGYWYDPRR